jgi:hypothetical protein
MANNMAIPQKLKTEFPNYPKILLLYSKELKVRFQRDVCSPMFTKTFTIAKM